MDAQYFYFDMAAGAGSWPILGKQVPGGAVIVHNIFGFLPGYSACLVEASNEHFTLLENMMGKIGDSRVRLECTTNERSASLLKQIDPKGRGVIYYDPGETPQYHVVLDAAKAAPNLDVLAHVGPALSKRQLAKKMNGRNVQEKYLMSLQEYIRTLNKSHNYITEETDGKQQWVMVYSTNDPNFYPPSDWLEVETEAGEELVYRLSMPEEKDKEEKDEETQMRAQIDLLNNPENWSKL